MKQLSSIVFCLILFFAAPAQARGNLLDIQEVVSSSGVKAWLVEDHSVPVISLKFSFKGMGAAGDPADKQGLSRMVSNTMDEGAGFRTGIDDRNRARTDHRHERCVVRQHTEIPFGSRDNGHLNALGH